jgi:hypothetical protein
MAKPLSPWQSSYQKNSTWMLGSLRIILQSQLFSICTFITQFVYLFLHNLKHPELLSSPCKLDFFLSDRVFFLLFGGKGL